MIKKLGKAFLCRILESQVARLKEKNKFKIVAVGGSVGKTSTKLAIAKTLSGSQRVIYQDGNYNDRLTVPLVLFSETEPAIFNIFAWMALLMRTSRKSKQVYPYDVAVLELGTDAPGQMEKFEYLNPDIYVLTAVADEHMEYFETLDAVALEELQPLKFSKSTLINFDDTPLAYLSGKSFLSYGRESNDDYSVVRKQARGLMGQQLEITTPKNTKFTVEVSALGEQGAKIVLAAAAVADQIGLSEQAILKGLQGITPVPGRMQILSGLDGSVLIDDTYNSSPVAVKAAIDVLSTTEADKRIALLGSMNELGNDSPALHAEIGEYCRDKNIDLIVTIGAQAEEHLAPAAIEAGCTVQSFNNPYDAGAAIKPFLIKGTVVLAKGSQNGVYAEEALKGLLSKPADQVKLVRQSKHWLQVKKQQFGPVRL